MGWFDRTPSAPERGTNEAAPADVGGAIVKAAERAAATRWTEALQAAAATEGTIDERLRQVEAAYTRTLVGVGAAVGMGSAVPGAGVVTFLGLTATELAWTTSRSAELVMTVGAIHGHTLAGVDERRSWILSVMLEGDAAGAQFAQLAGNAGRSGVGRGMGNRWFRWLNRTMTKRLVARFGTSRAAAAAGKALPFGIGAAVGGVANYAVARTVVRQARHLFETIDAPDVVAPLLPPPPALEP